MGREKNIRKLNFKPVFDQFIPTNGQINGVTNILDEEIEAIYLMDILGMYQEEAAKNMDVSRPTFTRILKNARKKLSTAIISGHKINIEHNKNNNYVVAICSDDEDLTNILNNQKFIFIFNIENQNITLSKKIDNPVYSQSEKPAIVLPKIFIENNVNLFISSKIGEGLKNTLISKGIKPLVKSYIEKDKLTLLIQ